MQTSFPATLMRGGTSKGLFIDARDLPVDEADRNGVLLAAMGSPDDRQIDGLGGAHPLTSKIAIMSKSDRPDADVDYLFLQVSVDKAEVSSAQNCGNMLAGASTGALLPTGSRIDATHGIDVTCIDNGMPVILIRAKDLGVTGYETPNELEDNSTLKETLEAIRLEMAPKMSLGDVRKKTVPKLTLLAEPKKGGLIMTRTFIPHRVHQAIGVLGAVSVATGCALPGTVAEGIANLPNSSSATKRYSVEHPTGGFEVDLEFAGDIVRKSALVRTARKLMSGQVFVPARTWRDA